MGCGQRRLGPMNLGWYGILSSIINGRNPIIAQSLVPKVNIHFGYQLFPVLFLLFSLRNHSISSPYQLVDIYLTVPLLIILTGLALVFIIFTPISACSKHSVLGSIRIISQLICFELIFTTILLLFILSWNDQSSGSISYSVYLNSVRLFIALIVQFCLYDITICFPVGPSKLIVTWNK
jgi:NADH:ubiquinone oxidoreductase subunit H